MSVITTHMNGDVLVVTADNPPVNALNRAVRQGLADAMAHAERDQNVSAVVIIANGRTFFAGADITEFGKPLEEPTLPVVCDQIEASTKPVIAAIHGTALGGGLEVALSCHYRIAVPSAQFGLPEVKLGLIPGAGGTQRLPRVIGIAAAAPIVTTGDPIKADEALAVGLIDRMAGASSLDADALAFARDVIGQPFPISSERRDKLTDRDAQTIEEYRTANARKLVRLDAPKAGLEALTASFSRPYPEGAALEKALFSKLMNGDQSRAMRHIFFAQRAAAKADNVALGTTPRTIMSVGILGAGTMGGGIAMNFLSAGIPVTILEREQSALDRGIALIRKNYDATASKGRMTADQVENAMALLTPTLELSDMSGCDLVIEAVFELMDIKKDVFRRLDQTIKQGAILATNTSALDVDEIASVTSRPQDVIGLHFFSPANVMKLLEVVRGAKTADWVLVTAMDLAKKIGKVAVISGVCHGFIGNRILARRQEQAEALVLEGATPAEVDQVLLDFGFPMGPFQMNDLAGNDLGWEAEKSSSSTLREILCENGRMGQKTRAGYYDYDENRKRTSSDEVVKMIRDFAAARNIPQHKMDTDEIRERLLYPMINEGALILEEGMAQRASDIDIVWLNGYGWPVYTGGPMFWADTIGLDAVVAGLRKHADKMSGFTLSRLLADKASKRETFNN